MVSGWVRTVIIGGACIGFGCGGQTTAGSSDPGQAGTASSIGGHGAIGGWVAAQAGAAGRVSGAGGQGVVEPCGNGIVEPELGEACDDGANGGGYGQCAPGCVWGGRCGDGWVQSPPEQCDDGNDVIGDGCSSCRLETPVPCPGYPGCLITVVCGDGKLGGAEACDDGNVMAGDGCPSDCRLVEPGYVCQVPGQPCRKHCGDGLVEPDLGEACDEGDLNGQPDHCDTRCGAPHCGDQMVQAEFGETCDDGVNDGRYGGCTPDCQRGPYCGDGVVQTASGEQCDFGDANAPFAYGGCTPECRYGPHCGDGILQPPYEECDDGNYVCCDGCSTHCRWELIPD